MQQLERRSDRWVSAALSVLLHGALIGVLVYGWWSFRHASRTPPTLAIDATVVSSKALKGGAAAQKPAPPAPVQTVPPPQTVAPPQTAPPPEQTVAPPPQTVAPPPQTTPPPQTPPPADDQTVSPAPKPDRAAEQAAAEQKAQAEAKRKKAEHLAQEKAAAERKAKEADAKRRAAEQQRLAEAKREEEKRKADEQRRLEAQRKADAERKAAEAKALAQSQADLQKSIAAEENLIAERSGPAMASWVQQIQARIQRAWIRPPTAREGIDCTIYVTQVPGGQIVNVKLGPCNGDEAVRQSIQDAAYRASPLPPPPDPALFERELQIEFKPTD
jgi:colicin import membrane protein